MLRFEAGNGKDGKEKISALKEFVVYCGGAMGQLYKTMSQGS